MVVPRLSGSGQRLRDRAERTRPCCRLRRGIGAAPSNSARDDSVRGHCLLVEVRASDRLESLWNGSLSKNCCRPRSQP